MGDTSLKWYNTKQSTLRKSITFNYATNSHFQFIHIPLKYICCSSKKILVAKDQFLKIHSNEISFECFSSSSLSHSLAYNISFQDVLSFQYAEKNCLFNLKTSKPLHKADGDLFSNTLWFCLDYSSFKDYAKILDELITTINCSVKPSIIPQKSYDAFKETMYKCDNVNNQLEFVSDWTTFLFSTTKDVSKSTDEDRIVQRKTPKNSKRKKEEFTFNPPTKFKVNKSEQKYVYCPSPNHSIEISSMDMQCLRPKLYMNDNIINLYITYIYHAIMTEKQRQRVHFFNCFFNTKLIGITKSPIMVQDTPKMRHERVAKWTKNVDIFDKDFLIIPVIESQHWFLVIVCFPWMAGIVDYTQLFSQSEQNSLSGIPINNTEFATKTRHEKLSLMKEEDSQLDPMPCILVFDSLSLQKRTDKVNIIREYLKSEWDAKRLAKDGPLVFDKTTVRGYCPKVPQQKNYTDCGVYLLHYLETFFKDPIKNFSVDFFKSFLTNWFDQADVDKKRIRIKNIIEDIIVKSEAFPSKDD